MSEPPARDEARERAIDRGVATAVFAVALVVYVRTAYRTLPGGDSGELIGAIVSSGVIHPPGYPLYALLGALFVHLPFGSPAFRLALLSAACDALAAALVTLGTTRATRSRAGGVTAGALFAFSPGVWRYAVAAEVFALNNLAIATLLLLAALYAETKDRRYAFGGALALGLGLSNHQTVVFTGIVVIAWAIACSRGDLLKGAVFGRLTVCGLFGLVPYLYLPVLASHHAFVSWGAADSWDGFWTQVLRREYGTLQLAPAGVGADVPASAVFDAWFHYTGDQMGPWALALALLGAVACGRTASKDPRNLALVPLAAPTLAIGVMMLLGNLPIGGALFRGILARFWQQPDLYIAVLAGVGVAALAKLARRRMSAKAVAGGEWALTAAVASLQVGTHYAEADHHDSHLVEDYGAEMLRVAPKNAILITKGDLITNSLRYVQLAHGVRPDVRIIDQELIATEWGTPLFAIQNPGVVFPGARLALDPVAGFQLKDFFDANSASPLVVCGGLAPGDHTTDASYGLWPAGFCDDVHASDAPVSLDDWIARAQASVPQIDFTGQAHPSGSWEDVVWGDYWEVRQAAAAHLLTVVGANEARRKYLSVAVDILQHVVDENPHVPAHVHKNLAISIGRVGITTPEQTAQAIRAWEGYLAVAPQDDPQLPSIRKELERLRASPPP